MTGSVRNHDPVVFIIDDDASVRDALGSLLRSVGLRALLFESPEKFLRAERPDAPGCIVLDVRMPGPSGLEFQLQLAKTQVELPIVFITGHGDIAMSVRAMKAGAIEFLTKPFRDQDLLDAIQLGFEKDRKRRGEINDLADVRGRFGTLTAREREIMALVVSGRLNKQIAAELNLSEVTVKAHRAQAMRKMKAVSLVELVRMADKIGLASRGGVTV
jgi:FixJ family two-component response regulator